MCGEVIGLKGFLLDPSQLLLHISQSITRSLGREGSGTWEAERRHGTSTGGNKRWGGGSSGGDQRTDAPQIHERHKDEGEDWEKNRRVGGKVITGMRGGTVGGGTDMREREREGADSGWAHMWSLCIIQNELSAMQSGWADDYTVQRYALITFGLLADLNVNVMSTADDCSKEKSVFFFFCLFILHHQKRKRSQRGACAIHLEGLQCKNYQRSERWCWLWCHL